MEIQKFGETQKEIDADSLPLPKTWAETIGLADYWERKAELEQLDPCETDEDVIDVGFVGPFFTIERDEPDEPDEPDEDELGQDWLPGYDITDADK